MTQQEAIRSILVELERAQTIHPNWPFDAIHGAAIVGEEAGELIRASLKYQYEKGTKEEMVEEAIQTAATCIRFLKNL